jgi:DNA (cytosine-5)-methyltransferase 1
MKSSNPHSGCRQVEVAKTLDTTDPNPCKNQGGIAVVCKSLDARGNGDGDVVSTLTGDHENRITDYSSVVVEPAVAYTMQAFGDYKDCGVASGLKARDYKDATDLVAQPIAIDRAFFNQGQNAQYDPQLYEDGTNPTLVARGPNAVAVRYIVRRLTPTERARLQGFPDKWGHPDQKEDFTDEEYRFWLEVRNTHATVIGGKEAKDYTKAQMLTWYNKLHTDSAEYKMWGNGIALPPALYLLQGMADVLNRNTV